MSRRGRIYRRCTACGKTADEKVCTSCRADARWAFAIDIGSIGGARKRISQSGFNTKREAVAKMSEIQSAVQRDEFVTPSLLIVGEYLEDWLDNRRSQLKPSTWRSYASNVRTHVVPAIGECRLKQLSPIDLDRFYRTLEREGNKRSGGALSPRTVRYIHTIIRRALKDALRKNLVTRNAADGASPPSSRQTRPTSDTMRTWTADQTREFLNRTSSDRLAALWGVALTTGMRRGELAALRWDDINLGDRVMSVRRNRVVVDGKSYEDSPKSGRGRTVALASQTVESLRRWRKAQAEERLHWGIAWQGVGHVFTRDDGGPLHPDSLTTAFKRAVTAAGLPVIRLHDARHTAASLALEAGVNPKVVSEMLGHSSVMVTLDVYSHVIPPLQESAAEQISALIFGS